MKSEKLHRMNFGSHFRAAALRAGPGELGSFLGVDHAWMSANTFPPHRHEGMSAVSYVFLDSETGVDNRDDIGTHNVIRPGGLHWTTAGRGIVHEEVPAEPGKTVHSLQIFVDLAPTMRGMAPAALSLEPEDVPSIQADGTRVRVPLGEYAGVQSPISPPTPVTVLDVALDAGSEFVASIPAGEAAFVLPIDGVIHVAGARFDANELDVPIWAPSREARDMPIRAGVERAKFVFFTGRPG